MNTLHKRRGSLEVQFRPGDGGRLAGLQYRGVELVLSPGRVPGFYGDTFWPSPQALFDWPPPPVLDAEPYEILSQCAHALAMRSALDVEYGLQVDKRFALFDDALTIGYSVTNIWTRPHTVAPWQVTRAPREGLLAWAEGEVFHDADRMRKQREDPGCWYLHAQSPVAFEGYAVGGAHASIPVQSVTRKSKFFTDARGWLAHIHHGVIFLRVFPDLSLAQMAPRQAELELFFDTERDYIELENQGPYQTLAPGQSLTYDVEWRFAEVDPALPTDRVTPELLDAVHSVLGRAPHVWRAPSS